MSLFYDPQELAYYDRLFSVIDKDNSGVLPGQDALPFLTSSGLPQQVLGEIWALADEDNNGFLTREAWYKAARLIGWAQKGETPVTHALASKSGALPTFAGHGVPPVTAAVVPSPSLAPLTSADRTKFTRIFVGCGPHNGLISGEKARDVFVKSQLGYDQLGQIWNLADTQQRGSLDLTDFIIGMYLIQACMANPSLTLPATLPPGTYEQASGGRPPTSVPLTPQRTGSSITPHHTGPVSPVRTLTTGTPSRTGTISQAPTILPQSLTGWDVTPDAKVTSDRFFSQLDPQNKGKIEGDVAVPFMLQSQLDENTLATIWDLADIKHEGKLDRDQFAVAMYLINAKLAGQDVPASLPDSLVPPSLRGVTGGDVGSKEGSSGTTKDLFDLFDDTPVSTVSATPITSNPAPVFSQPSAQGTRAFSPSPASPPATTFTRLPNSTFSPPALSRIQSPGIQHGGADDLLGDESVPSVPENSAEIGNKQNQLDNVKRSLEDVTKTRADLDASATSSGNQLSELEAKLSEARTKHDGESKAVADLRIRVQEQSARLQQLQADVITAESDVSALRSEKDELEQALLRDKEEVRGLQKRMKEVDEERNSLRSLLEKLKKESRQQKGMVSIAKKQLSTAESGRENVRKEVDDESAVANAASNSVAAEQHLPASPLSPTLVNRALSPNATGSSQRSNNPFDRLSRNNSNPTGIALVGAGAAAAAGVVAAGAETLYHAAKETVAGSGSTTSNGESQSEPAEAAKLSSHPGSAVVSPPVSAPVLAQSDSQGSQAVPTIERASTSGSGPDAAAGESVQPHETEEDPFGAPVHPPAPEISTEDPTFAQGGFEDAFGQTSSEQVAAKPVSAPQGESEFDKAFAGFDSPAADHEPVAVFDSRGDQHSSTVEPGTPGATAAASESKTTPVTRTIDEGEASSDDDAGPEDADAPGTWRPSSPRSAPVEAPTRRSAPPPPGRALVAQTDDASFGSAKDNGTDAQASTFAPTFVGNPATDDKTVSASESDPFSGASTAAPLTEQGISSQTVQAPSKTANFDDDEFDFPDLSPAHIEQEGDASRKIQPQSSAFDDEFAGFDDEFGPSVVSGSDKSNNSTALTKSYEMVSPVPPTTDEFGAPQQVAPPQTALSFEDAFGGDFEPSPATATPALAQVAAPSNAATLTAPGLPERKDSTVAQSDDIEDVKKLCAMGFPRTLVIAALDANGYDFQQSLNVLLAQ